MRLARQCQSLTGLFTIATVIYAVRTKQSYGSFLKVPFEFRVPTLPRARERLWNREDQRIFTPHVFGVGWSLNVYQVLKRLGFGEKHDGELTPPDSLPGSVAVARQPLELKSLVRIQAGQRPIAKSYFRKRSETL